MLNIARGIGAAVIVAMTVVPAFAQEKQTVGYITKSATNAGWIMINQGAC